MAIDLNIPDIRTLRESEPLADYLKRRQRELAQQIAALEGTLAPKRRELEEIHKAMQAVGLYAQPLLTMADGDAVDPAAAPSNGIANIPQIHGAPPEGVANVPYHPTLTIKEMILSAFRDHFRDGATPAELRDYMKNVFGRDIDRTSISPALARLRDQGGIEQSDGAADSKWRLKAGAGSPFQDDHDGYLLKLAESLAWRDEDEQIKPPEPERKDETAEQPKLRRPGQFFIKKRKIP